MKPPNLKGSHQHTQAHTIYLDSKFENGKRMNVTKWRW